MIDDFQTTVYMLNTKFDFLLVESVEEVPGDFEFDFDGAELQRLFISNGMA